MAGEIDVALREEIVECQRTRSEFIRWKLILVAAVGAAALGVGQDGKSPVRHPALLALIPLICVYVDSVCLHNDTRIRVIAQFFRTSSEVSTSAKAYEVFCTRHRRAFYHEAIAVFGSSVVLAALVAVVAVTPSTIDAMSITEFVKWLVFGAGIAGLLGTAWLVQRSRSLRRFEHGGDDRALEADAGTQAGASGTGSPPAQPLA